MKQPRGRKAKHGMWKSPEWNSWDHMKRRCNNPKDPKYPLYGGRGIKVCERWLGEDGFENFYSDMGNRPDKCSIDRIDNNGNYEPGNCRWANNIQQSRNVRRNRLITHNGETMCLAEWADKLDLGIAMLSSRLHMGWSEGKALDTPKQGATFNVDKINARRKSQIRCYEKLKMNKWEE